MKKLISISLVSFLFSSCINTNQGGKFQETNTNSGVFVNKETGERYVRIHTGSPSGDNQNGIGSNP